MADIRVTTSDETKDQRRERIFFGKSNQPPSEGGGKRFALLSDVYHFLLICRWRYLISLFFALYFVINCFFGSLYLLGGNVIENARPGSFWDCFFFSVQTISTVGYGFLHPIGAYANILVSIECVFGLLGFAMVSGLMLAKFTRPTAKVIFSRNAVITIRDGVPSLMFRMANGRSSHVIGAQLDLVLVRSDTTPEGETVRRMFDLKLVRGRSPVFALTWTAVHPIDASSPLLGQSAEGLRKTEAIISLTFTGMESTFSQPIHAQHVYRYDEILWNQKMVDILTPLPDGSVKIDYSSFHATVAETTRAV